MSRRFLRGILPALLFALWTACTADSPSGPTDPNQPARIAGQVTGGSSLGRALVPADGDALGGVRVEVRDAAGRTLFTTSTDPDGEFRGTIPPGEYTVILELDSETSFSFDLEVPPGGAFFVEAKIDLDDSGRFKLDAEIFRDRDGDGEPDDSFRIRIHGRLAGDPDSGTEEVVDDDADSEDDDSELEDDDSESEDDDSESEEDDRACPEDDGGSEDGDSDSAGDDGDSADEDSDSGDDGDSADDSDCDTGGGIPG